MTKEITAKQKINYLMIFLSEKEKSLFKRMYGDYPDTKSKERHAVSQIENTLNKRCFSLSRSREEIEELENVIEKLKKEKKDIKEKNRHLQEEVVNLNKIEASGTRVVTTEEDKRLAKLAALEAGGVDNWEWYDTALEDWFNKYN